MMKGNYRYIHSLLAVVAVTLFCNGCVEHMDEMSHMPTDHVSFKASIGVSDKVLSTKGMVGSLDWKEEDWLLDTEDSKFTRASLYNTLNQAGTAGVYGYIYSGDWSAEVSPLSGLIDGNKYIFDGDELNAEKPVRWSLVEEYVADKSKFKVFTYAPKDALTPLYQTPAKGGEPAKGAPVINIPDVLAKDDKGKYLYQTDILVADNECVVDLVSKSHRKDIALDFEHIFTAIQFKAGFDCTITGVSINGVNIGGKYVIGTGWESLVMTDTLVDLDVDDGTILMIPQKMPDDGAAKITVKYREKSDSEDKYLSASLNGVEWKQGKKISYTLKKESDRKYIYLDLAAGDVKITGKTYEGYVFVGGNPKPVSGTIASGQEYYIYQSCKADVNKESKNYKVGWTGYDSDKQQGTGTFTLPSYPLVTYNNQLWSDFITNNDDVEEVIEAWDDSNGANSNSGFSADKAVRIAGREATKYTISISGNIGNCKMIVDNIYCSNQHQGQNRTWGSISYIPTWDSNSDLTLNLIGDNRLGCLHYNNNSGSSKGNDEFRNANTNHLIIEGEGSLTVADADFYKSGGGYYQLYIRNRDQRRYCIRRYDCSGKQLCNRCWR